MTKAHNKSGTGSQKPVTVNTKTTQANKQRTDASSTSGSTSQPNAPKSQSAPSISIQTENPKEKQSSQGRKLMVEVRPTLCVIGDRNALINANSSKRK